VACLKSDHNPGLAPEQSRWQPGNLTGCNDQNVLAAASKGCITSIRAALPSPLPDGLFFFFFWGGGYNPFGFQWMTYYAVQVVRLEQIFCFGWVLYIITRVHQTAVESYFRLQLDAPQSLPANTHDQVKWSLLIVTRRSLKLVNGLSLVSKACTSTVFPLKGPIALLAQCCAMFAFGG